MGRVVKRVAAVAVCVLVVVVALVLVPRLAGGGRPGARRPGGVTLPQVVAGPATLVNSAGNAPAGPAVALVGNAELPGWGDLAGGGQELAVGADGRSYRSLTAPAPFTGATHGDGLLSPDGTHAMVGGSGGTLRLVDLTTGASRTFRLHPDGYTRTLAFSPDGRAVVCGWTPNPDSTWVTPSLLDLASGHSTPLARAQSPAAAFSPDGDRIALQSDGGVTVIDRSTNRARRLTDLGGQLANGHAWSPDGHWLAISTDAGAGIHFVPADPADATPRLAQLADQTEDFLCWASASTIIAAKVSGLSSALVAESLTTGTTQHLSTIHATLEDVAPTLLATLAAHPRTSTAAPDYGPLPRWSTRFLVLLSAVLAALVSLAWPAGHRLSAG